MKKQIIPAYGCLVRINTAEQITISTIPVTILCLLQTGLSMPLIIAPHIPFSTVIITRTKNRFLIHPLIPVSINKDTDDPDSGPFPKTGIKIKTAMNTSSRLQINSAYLRKVFFLSSFAAIIISSAHINSSIVTEKNFEISFRESILGYPLPDSHFEIAALDT